MALRVCSLLSTHPSVSSNPSAGSALSMSVHICWPAACINCPRLPGASDTSCQSSCHCSNGCVQTVLTQCIRPHHGAASSLLHGGEQARYTAQRIGCICDDAELPCALGLEVLQYLRHPGGHQDEVVGIVCCCNHGYCYLACNAAHKSTAQHSTAQHRTSRVRRLSVGSRVMSMHVCAGSSQRGCVKVNLGSRDLTRLRPGACTTRAVHWQWHACWCPPTVRAS